MDEEKNGMSTPLRLLVSVVGVGAMFALGRLVRAQLGKRSAAAVSGSRPRLRAVPSPVVPEEEASAADANAEKEESDPNRIIIHVPAAQVYEHARKLEYFENVLFGLGLQMTVIIDQPGEFFGVRVEHDGELYGTVLVHLEEIPGKDGGTEVSINVKYKHDFGVYSKETIEAAVNKEIASYLTHLKESCEAGDRAAI